MFMKACKSKGQNPFLMKDYHIRTALKRYLLIEYRNDPDTVVLDELGVLNGIVRIDIVVVNGFLHGYELKSDKDTLERLPEQSRAYNSVFDRIILVVGYRHAYEAIKNTPEWWGIKIAEMGENDTVSFFNFREAQDNPSLDALSIARLLWRDEALTFLDEIASADGFRSKPRAKIYNALIEKANLDLIRARVRRQLKTRLDWKSDEIENLNDGLCLR
jgi:hypothetical protein